MKTRKITKDTPIQQIVSQSIEAKDLKEAPEIANQLSEKQELEILSFPYQSDITIKNLHANTRLFWLKFQIIKNESTKRTNHIFSSSRQKTFSQSEEAISLLLEKFFSISQFEDCFEKQNGNFVLADKLGKAQPRLKASKDYDNAFNGVSVGSSGILNYLYLEDARHSKSKKPFIVDNEYKIKSGLRDFQVWIKHFDEFIHTKFAKEPLTKLKAQEQDVLKVLKTSDSGESLEVKSFVHDSSSDDERATIRSDSPFSGSKSSSSSSEPLSDSLEPLSDSPQPLSDSPEPSSDETKILRKQIATLKAQLVQLSAEAKAREEIITEFKRDNDNLRTKPKAEIKDSRQQMARFYKYLQYTAKYGRDPLEQEQYESSERRRNGEAKAKLLAENKELRDQVAYLDDQFYPRLAVKQSEIDAKQLELNAVMKQGDELKSKISELQQQMESIQVELHNKDETIASLVTLDTEKLINEKLALEKLLAEQEEIIQTLTPAAQEVVALQKRINEVEREKILAYQEKKKSNEEAQKLQLELRKLEKEKIQDISQEKARLEQLKIKELQSEKERLQAANKDEVEELRQKVAQYDQSFPELKEQIAKSFQLEDQVQELSAQNAELSQTFEDLQKQSSISLQINVNETNPEVKGKEPQLHEDKLLAFTQISTQDSTQGKQIRELKAVLKMQHETIKQYQFANAKNASLKQQPQQEKKTSIWKYIVGAVCLIAGAILIGTGLGAAFGAPLAILGLSVTFGGALGSGLAIGGGLVAAIGGGSVVGYQAISNSQLNQISTVDDTKIAMDVNALLESSPRSQLKAGPQLTRSVSTSTFKTVHQVSELKRSQSIPNFSTKMTMFNKVSEQEVSSKTAESKSSLQLSFRVNTP